MGKDVIAYLLVDIFFKSNGDTIEEENLCNKIKKYPGVDDISIVTGKADIIVKVRVENMDKLREFSLKFLRNLDGVRDTTTLVVLKELDF
ncbi:MAG: Lrp/AsnC ligand binding domain-containing protein [Candidatus Woesearchaeota archaeon]|nr:MAG: Lrp/AsnC ligand binding domain-containing protein [Candidatus Woesearchaeota archaeon]